MGVFRDFAARSGIPALTRTLGDKPLSALREIHQSGGNHIRTYFPDGPVVK